MPAVPRRALPGLAGVVVLTAACDPFGSSSGPVPGPTLDELLVDRVVADVRRMRDLATASGHPELAAMHTAHLAVLGVPAGPAPATPSPTTPPTVPATPTALEPGEEALKASLAAGAAAAQSGSLARVLASMAAAVAQQLTVLGPR